MRFEVLMVLLVIMAHGHENGSSRTLQNGVYQIDFMSL